MSEQDKLRARLDVAAETEREVRAVCGAAEGELTVVAVRRAVAAAEQPLLAEVNRLLTLEYTSAADIAEHVIRLEAGDEKRLDGEAIIARLTAELSKARTATLEATGVGLVATENVSQASGAAGAQCRGPEDRAAALDRGRCVVKMAGARYHADLAKQEAARAARNEFHLGESASHPLGDEDDE